MFYWFWLIAIFLFSGNGNEGRRHLGGLHGPFLDADSESGPSSTDDDDDEDLEEWLNNDGSSDEGSDVNIFDIDAEMGGKHSNHI